MIHSAGSPATASTKNHFEIHQNASQNAIRSQERRIQFSLKYTF